MFVVPLDSSLSLSMRFPLTIELQLADAAAVAACAGGADGVAGGEGAAEAAAVAITEEPN